MMKSLHISFTGFLLIILVACGDPVETTEQEDNSITVTSTFTQRPTPTSTLTPSETSTQTSTSARILFTPTATLNPTQQIWLSTFTIVEETQRAIDEKIREKTNQRS